MRHNLFKQRQLSHSFIDPGTAGDHLWAGSGEQICMVVEDDESKWEVELRDEQVSYIMIIPPLPIKVRPRLFRFLSFSPIAARDSRLQ